MTTDVVYICISVFQRLHGKLVYLYMKF